MAIEQLHLPRGVDGLAPAIGVASKDFSEDLLASSKWPSLPSAAQSEWSAAEQTARGAVVNHSAATMNQVTVPPNLQSTNPILFQFDPVAD